jgi:lipoyl(octanoyl) transferase
MSHAGRETPDVDWKRRSEFRDDEIQNDLDFARARSGDSGSGPDPDSDPELPPGYALTEARLWAVAPHILLRSLGNQDYIPVWRAMQRFTANRNPDTADEIWLLEHPPIFTVGLNGKPEHYPRSESSIPLVKIDRGGQITYHGPGQVILYLLLDLNRLGLGVRALVGKMERAVIELLNGYGIRAEARPGAPGVYVGGAKIAALGLRVKKGCCYHGLAFNVDMDLTPFSLINPCGYLGLKVVQARDLGIHRPADVLGRELIHRLVDQLYTYEEPGT